MVLWSNTKLLVFASLFILISGLSFLWFGINKEIPLQPSPTPIPSIESPSTATPSAAFEVNGEGAIVSKVVDGDTIELAGGQTVRLIGIDTPETVDPRRPVGCFGKEASNEAKNLLLGKEVILQKDVSEQDKYGRLLRLVFLPLEDGPPSGEARPEGGQTLFVNDYLIREGFAKVLTYPPDVKYNEQFRQAEKEARENKRGLWGRCTN